MHGDHSAALDTADWRADRDLLARHGIGLAELFERRGLTLRSDWLAPWSVWITPEFEPRRFHTWFLLARCPVEQRVLGISGESTAARWIRPDDALRQADRDELPLLPPQYCTFLELHGFRALDQLFAARRAAPVVAPALAVDGRGPYLALPDDLVELGVRIGHRMYDTTEELR
ncbi:hypothetical protein AB0H42_27265 [Nocardia sp. NPDC050799]|uniref:hypothetical protein n=1 Tax=Nocardia sp. NPDC050799 TaxID=3154842 RepID=UPI003410114E